jgi:hypothetical protein
MGRHDDAGRRYGDRGRRRLARVIERVGFWPARKRCDGRGRAGSSSTDGSGGGQRLGEIAPRGAPGEGLWQVQHDTDTPR